MLLSGLPSVAAPLFFVPYVIGVLALASAVLAVVAWRRRFWTRWGRLHYSIVAAANVALQVYLWSWGLIGP